MNGTRRLIAVAIAALAAVTAVGVIGGGIAAADDVLYPDAYEGDPPDEFGTKLVIGIDWGLENKDGTALIWKADARCTDTRVYVTYNLQGSGWNDRISSGEGYSGCNRFKHYEDANFGGSVRICDPTCNSMGTMNNQTSSLKWKHT